MNTRKWAAAIFAGGAIAFAAMLGTSATSLERPAAAVDVSGQSARVGVASVDGGHSHSVLLLDSALGALIAQAGTDGTVEFQSSGGIVEGETETHAHALKLTSSQLSQLQSRSNVTVTSREANGHTHEFRFMTDSECSGTAPQSPGATPTSTSTPVNFCELYPEDPACSPIGECIPGEPCPCTPGPDSICPE